MAEARYVISKVRNKKTGKTYLKLDDAVDCTNERDGTPVVIYTDDDFEDIYVRAAVEFAEKFEDIQ